MLLDARLITKHPGLRFNNPGPFHARGTSKLPKIDSLHEPFPHEDYGKLVGTKVPVRDATDNGYQGSLTDDFPQIIPSGRTTNAPAGIMRSWFPQTPSTAALRYAPVAACARGRSTVDAIEDHKTRTRTRSSPCSASTQTRKDPIIPAG